MFCQLTKVALSQMKINQDEENSIFKPLTKDQYDQARLGDKLYNYIRVGKTPITIHKYWYDLCLYRNCEDPDDQFDYDSIFCKIDQALLEDSNGCVVNVEDKPLEEMVEIAKKRLTTLIEVLVFNLGRLEKDFVFLADE
jgi:hypothetical protein